MCYIEMGCARAAAAPSRGQKLAKEFQLTPYSQSLRKGLSIHYVVKNLGCLMLITMITCDADAVDDADVNEL